MAPEQRFSIEPVPGDPFYKHIVRRTERRQNTTCETQDEDLSVRMGRTLLSLSEERPHPYRPEDPRQVSGRTDPRQIKRQFPQPSP